MFEDNMSRYADIINLPRPKSSHKPMSMHDRAAQFSPFSALTGLDDELAETARIVDSKIERTRLHKHIRTSFRKILPQTALKILAGRQPACGFLPCLQQNYARKSAHISYEDRFL